MERRYGVQILTLCFLMLLAAHNVHAYPYSMEDDPKKGIALFPANTDNSKTRKLLLRYSRDSEGRHKRDEAERLIEKVFQNDELLNPMERFKQNKKNRRDTMELHETQTTKKIPEIKITANRQTKEQQFRRQLGLQSEQSDGRIVFPDAYDYKGSYDSMKKKVPICSNSTFCEDAISYPEDIINEAIQRNESIKYFAGEDVMTDVGHRIAVTDDEPLCLSIEKIVYPRSGENKQKEWLFIVNQENFKQGVRIETCSDENNSCRPIGGIAGGYNTTCRQKYIYRKLASVGNDKSVAPDMFRFPSSCCCHVSFNGGIRSRIGLPVEKQKSPVTPAKTRKRK